MPPLLQALTGAKMLCWICIKSETINVVACKPKQAVEAASVSDWGATEWLLSERVAWSCGVHISTSQDVQSPQGCWWCRLPGCEWWVCFFFKAACRATSSYYMQVPTRFLNAPCCFMFRCLCENKIYFNSNFDCWKSASSVHPCHFACCRFCNTLRCSFMFFLRLISSWTQLKAKEYCFVDFWSFSRLVSRRVSLWADGWRLPAGVYRCQCIVTFNVWSST